MQLPVGYYRVQLAYGPFEDRPNLAFYLLQTRDPALTPNALSVEIRRQLLALTGGSVVVPDDVTPNPFVQTYRKHNILTANEWFLAATMVLEVRRVTENTRIAQALAQALVNAEGPDSPTRRNPDSLALELLNTTPETAANPARPAMTLERRDAPTRDAMTPWVYRADGFEAWEHTSNDGRSVVPTPSGTRPPTGGGGGGTTTPGGTQVGPGTTGTTGGTGLGTGSGGGGLQPTSQGVSLKAVGLGALALGLAGTGLWLTVGSSSPLWKTKKPARRSK